MKPTYELIRPPSCDIHTYDERLIDVDRSLHRKAGRHGTIVDLGVEDILGTQLRLRPIESVSLTEIHDSRSRICVRFADRSPKRPRNMPVVRDVYECLMIEEGQ